MRQLVASHINQAIERAQAQGTLVLATRPESAVERPRDPLHGDWASTIALKLAKELGKNPREIAQIIVEHLAQDDTFVKVEIAGPGFINLTLSDAALYTTLRQAYEQDTQYARADVSQGKTINVEFISANPTGPMHVGHGRWAALGNALCNVLEHAGWQVTREFYINDAGSQMDKFGESVAVRYLQQLGIEASMPEDGYHGAYVTDIAKSLVAEHGREWVEAVPAERMAALRELSYALMLKSQQDTCERLGVRFDVWFSERSLYEPAEPAADAADSEPAADAQAAATAEPAADAAEAQSSGTSPAASPPQSCSPIKAMLSKLNEGNYLYELDEATWFRTTDFSDDKDRVLIKSDGSYTYFAPDIAYHLDKFERPVTKEHLGGGSEFLIDIWGADHHGYIPRMQAAVSALGHEGKLSVVLGQLVNLYRDGQQVRMSKRTGEMITFEELVEEVGADATKYLMLSRSSDQPIDFDIEVAKKQDATNPVYYVQYAHARICSVLRKAAERGLNLEELAQVDDATLALLQQDTEKDLIRFIGQLSELVEQCARDLAPFKLTHYAEELAAKFHKFYTQCIIVSEDKELTLARLYLSETARRVLALTLGFLGVSAPERM